MIGGAALLRCNVVSHPRQHRRSPLILSLSKDERPANDKPFRPPHRAGCRARRPNHTEPIAAVTDPMRKTSRYASRNASPAGRDAA